MKKPYDFSSAHRGPVVPPESGTTAITLRIDDEVLMWFREQVNRSGGGDYLKLINNALREHVRQQSEPIEEVLRRVVREEMRRAA
ncbi:MAG: hypothetical protein QG599_2077 [Pseudomonadota bacterium]|nr:hypothetical protein [Pseudomonadota bacterium]